MKKRLIPYQDELIKSLQDQDEAQEYLNAALRDNDLGIFLLALKNVLEAQGGDMATLAEKTQLNRENLYRMLSKRGNPKLINIISVLSVLGLQFTIQLHKN